VIQFKINSYSLLFLL